MEKIHRVEILLWIDYKFCRLSAYLFKKSEFITLPLFILDLIDGSMIHMNMNRENEFYLFISIWSYGLYMFINHSN